MNPIYFNFMVDEEEREVREIMRLQRRDLRDTLDPLTLPNEDFRKLFRLNKELFLSLVEELTPHMTAGQRITKIPVKLRILAALRFFATGSYQRGIGAEYNASMAQQTISNIIDEVGRALQEVSDRWVTFPTSENEVDTVKLGFMQKFGFPGVVGAIDGTHVAILQPLEDEHVYLNRKGFHSKNVQIVCDTNLIILNVNANYGGSAHDSFIWRNSVLFDHLEQKWGRGDHGFWLIGDSGYPQQPWLMTPIRNTIEGTPERRYDNTLSSARNCVERCIGVLKARFRCLMKERVLRYDPHKVGIIINACCVLHNMCIRNNVPLDEVEENENDDLGGPQVVQAPNNVLREGQRRRQQLIHDYFTI